MSAIMYNSTVQSWLDDDDVAQDRADLISTILTSIYIIFAILGIVGNALVLIVIARVKDLQDFTNLLIANQSLIDLVTSLLLLFGYVVPLPTMPTDRSMLSQFLCRFWYTKYPFWATIVSSCLNLAMITIERYVAVVFPLRYRVQNITAGTIAITLIPWVAGFLFKITAIYFSKVVDGQCLGFLSPNDVTRIAISLSTYFVEFLLPVLTMIIVYSRMLIELRRSANEFARSDIASTVREADQIGEAGDFRSKARKNIIKTLAIVSICFIICMSLNQHIFLAYSFGMYLDFWGPLYVTSVVMAFGNIWINPFIYTFQYGRFKKAVKKLFGLTPSKPHNVSSVIKSQSSR